jgi:hypothetical protein
MASSVPHSTRIDAMSPEIMQLSLADTAETCALIVRRKYRLVFASLTATLAALLLHVISVLVR